MRIASLLLIFTLACQQSDQQRLAPAKSWAASLAFAGELWLENRVPDSLIENSVASARKAIAETNAPAEFKGTLDELSDSASALAAAVRKHDVKSAMREIARCKRIRASLDSL